MSNAQQRLGARGAAPAHMRQGAHADSSSLARVAYSRRCCPTRAAARAAAPARILAIHQAAALRGRRQGATRPPAPPANGRVPLGTPK